MAERARALSKSASTNSMHGEKQARSSSIFSSWRSSSRRGTASSRRDTAGQAAAAAPSPPPGLEGKELRDAMWKQQRQHESQAQAVARPMRVIRYSPPRGNPTSSTTTASSSQDEADDDDDDLSMAGSVRGAGPQEGFNYDEDYMHPRSGAKRSKEKSKLSRSLMRPSPSQQSQHHMDDRTSRLSLTFSRLSFSASARNSLADYKAKKYDVAWQKDDEVADCQVCHSAFTKWKRRRHHCRVCGDIICDDCSPDQVHIDGRFTRAKRACVACVGLLEAMMHLGDPHVRMVVEKDAGLREWIDATPAKKDAGHPQVYHDRLAEIQRVTAAGAKARRPGNTDVRQCVIQASWLRAWLAYTSHDATDDGDDFQTKKDRTESVHSTSGRGLEAPGPIDNLSLLVMRKGCLLPRDGLVRVETNQELHSGDGDFQTIPLEVWDVLSRYYGGGPRIEIVVSSIAGEPDQWVVDVAHVLQSGRAQQLNAQAPRNALAPPTTVQDKVLERALSERHDPFSILLDLPGASSRTLYDPMASLKGNSASSSTASTRGGIPPAFHRSVSDNSLAHAVDTSASATASRRGINRSPAHSATAKAEPPPPSVRRAQPEPAAEPEPEMASRRNNEPGTRRSSRPPPMSPPRESSAASAASAFAIAMKEARLKQQRAIAGGHVRSAAFE
jgi:hypothetical protein